jgi:hypothetical protein
MSNLFVFATTQPVFPSCAGPSGATTALTFEDRRKVSDLAGARKTGHIPVCINHAGGELGDGSFFRVPRDKIIGRMIDAFVIDGKLTNTLEIYHEYADIIEEIMDDLIHERRKWGVSLGTDFVQAHDRPEILEKAISHIGITTDPQYGNSDTGATWIHLVSRSPIAFYKELKEKFLDPSQDVYMAPETRARIERFVGQSDVAPPLKPSEETTTPAPLSQEQRAPLSSSPDMATAENNGAAGASATTPVPASAPVPALMGGGDQNESARYSRFHDQLQLFYKKIWPEGPNNSNGSIVDEQSIEMAQELSRELHSLIKDKPMSALPMEAKEADLSLEKYLRHSGEKAILFAKKLNLQDGLADTIRAGLNFREQKAVMPQQAQGQPFNPTKTIIAMSNAYEKECLANAEAVRLKFESEHKAYLEKEQEWKNNLKKQEEELVSLKRAREEADKKALELEGELKIKRAKLEALETPASQSKYSAELGAASTVPGATAAGIPISTGASRDPTATTTTPAPASAPAHKLFQVEDKFRKMFMLEHSPIDESKAKYFRQAWSGSGNSDPINDARFRF